MAKHWSVTCFMALALVGCFIGTLVEAQKSHVVPPDPQVPRFVPPPPQKPKVPAPQHPQPIASKKLPSYQQSEPVHSCEVAERQRVACGSPDITAAACDAINCCFDGRQCYYGKAVTVQCTKDGQFIVVVARDATLPHIDLDTISLLEQDQGCTHVDSNSGFAIYQFPVTACGSVVMEESGVIIYENRMTSSYEVEVGRIGVITRDSSYQLLFQCRYIGTSVEAVVVEVLIGETLPFPIVDVGPMRVQLRLANGQCNTKGCNEVDVAFSSFYTEQDYPVTKVLRDPVYVEIQLMDKTDSNLVLTLGHCWATTSHECHSLPQWNILIDGCPYRDDRYLSSVIPVGDQSGLDFPTHHKRFSFKMFTFVDTNSLVRLQEQIYIHCTTSVCTPGPGISCDHSCYRKQRDLTAVAQKKVGQNTVVSNGPVIMRVPEQ